MSLRLRHLGDMNDGRHVLHAHDRRGVNVRFTQRGIIPALDRIHVESLLLLRIALKSFQQLGEIALRDLELIRDGDAIAVVPDGDEHRHLQHAPRIDRLPEHPLGAAGIADRAPGDLVAVSGKLRHRLQLVELAIQLRGPGQSDQSRHLRSGR